MSKLHREPIAIVGIGCRFPGGASSPEEFWTFLNSKGNGICEIPSDRWSIDGFYDPDPVAIARASTKWGGFLESVRAFDAEFFDISPREASSMDPQQRIALQVVYEAIQDSRLRIADLQDQKTGVFVGVSVSDYGGLQRLRKTTNEIYAGTGAALSIVANRISHRFNLSGPSYSVDTACSSSLVAVDQACMNLLSGECATALVCGVNVFADPAGFVAFSKAGMLSETGTISTFDARANGYVRGEGCGAVVLKRLSDAERDGNDIYAVIRSTGINQDGQTPTLTAPNPARQVLLLKQLCEKVGIDTASVDYVEAHGTGTPIGDPIEATAIGTVFGSGGTAEPTLVGSVKPNIGHLESAAGISGLIKSALVVKNSLVPPNRNFEDPNPNIPFETLGIAVPQQATAIGNGVCRAAVNSFGFGGTNASALVERYEPVRKYSSAKRSKVRDVPVAPYCPVALSAATETSLRAFAGRLADQLGEGGSLEGVSAKELSAHINAERDHFKHRAVCLTGPEDLEEQLRDVADDSVDEPAPRTLPHTLIGQATQAPKVAFTFAGQGGQWWAMGRGLLEAEPAFRAKVKEFDKIFRDIAGWSIISELKRSEGKSRVHESEVTQPAIFAIQIGLAALWQRAGVRPDVIVGHSFGEVAAAYVAGALSLETAAKLIHRRGLIASVIGETGAMMAVGMSSDQLLDFMDTDDVDIAAYNGPTMVTVSGESGAIDHLEHRLTVEKPEVLARRLAMNIPWHSRALDPAEAWFRDGIGEIEWQAPSVPFISTVTGRPETCLDTDYWWQNLRQPVAYERSVGVALKMGAEFFLELGPHRTLSGLSVTIASALDAQIKNANSLLQNVDDFHAVGVAAATMYTSGIDIDWSAFVGDPQTDVSLPSYPWDQDDYWVESEETSRRLHYKPGHPLLGTRDAGPHPIWDNEINLTAFGYIADHAVSGDVIFPAAGYMDMMFAAGLEYFGQAPIELENLSISDALFIAQDDDILLKTVFDEDSGRIRIFSHLRDSSIGWVERASARLSQPDVVVPEAQPLGQAKYIDRLEKDDFYALALRHGFQYGTHFQGAQGINITAHGVEAHIRSTDFVEKRAELHAAHPSILDSSIQTAIPLADISAGVDLRGNEESEESDAYPLYLPIGADRVRFYAPLSAEANVIVLGDEDAAGDNLASYTITKSDGTVCLKIDGFRMKKMEGEGASSSEATTKALFHRESFISVPMPTNEIENAGEWLILSGGQIGCNLSKAISDLGGFTHVRRLSLEERSDKDFLIDLLTEWLKVATDPQGIVVCWPLDAKELSGDVSSEELQAETEKTVLSCTAMGQAIDHLRDNGPYPHVWILTEGARALPGDAPLSERGLIQSPVVGLSRTFASECVEFDFRHLDLENSGAAAVSDMAEVMLRGTEETELVFRGGEIFVPRIDSPETETLPKRPILLDPKGADANYVATMISPGSLDAIQLQETDLEPVGADDVRVAVSAVGLNFRDIMAATGLLPEEAETEPAYRNLGLEYGGTVVEVGSAVSSLVPGDRVMGMGKRCLQAYTNQPAAILSKIPDTLDLSEAATIPSAFATAHYALNHVGRLAKGEYVLIHAATGGVGLAAIQLAKRAGAEIIATVGSPHKREHLENLGIKHILNSRSLDFADRVLEITNGQGVDVILNSLPADFILKGLDVLAPYGRFLEIGKRDVYADSLIGLKALRRNASLAVIDLASMGHERPQLLRQLVDEVVDMLADGDLEPLPVTAFPITEVSEAFRYMSQARHIGKVVVTLPDETVPVLSADDKELCLSRDKSYLITGGSRGFGITVARWMSERGAGQVVLASRSGRPDEDQQSHLQAIEANGTAVRHLPLDVTNESDVAKAVAELATGPRPLAGIIHGAAVIIDGFLGQMDETSVTSVLRPKTMGAWNLHRAVEQTGQSLDFFVQFSSLAQVMGSSGQSNYVAANSFLEAISHYRSGRDLSGQTMHWGALADSGFVSRSDSMTTYLESMGMAPITDEDALDGLERLLGLETPAIAYGSVDWATVARTNPKAGTVPRLKGVLETGNTGGGRIRADIAEAPRDQWPDLLANFLVDQIVKVLKVDADTIDLNKALTELGFDSLSSIELKNRVERQLGISIPVSAFLQSPTLLGLSDTICDTIEEDLRKQASAATGGGTQNGDASGASRNDAKFRPSHDQHVYVAASTGSLASVAGRRELEHTALVKLNSAVEAKRVRSAWRSLLKRHPLLRLTASPARAAGEFQLTLDGAPQVEVVDDPKTELEQPLDVENGQLVRLVVTQNARKTELGLKIHFSVADDQSFALVFSELLRLVDGQKLPKRIGDSLVFRTLSKSQFDEERDDALAARAHWVTMLKSSALPVSYDSRRRALIPLHFGSHRDSPSRISFELDWHGETDSAEVVVLAALARALKEDANATDFVIERASHSETGDDQSRACLSREVRAPIFVRTEGRALYADIAQQLDLSDKHGHLGTAFIEMNLADECSEPAALRQFGFKYADRSQKDRMSQSLKALSVDGGEVRLTKVESGNGFFYDLSLAVVRKNSKTLAFTLSFDSDVFDEVRARKIAKGIARHCDRKANVKKLVARVVERTRQAQDRGVLNQPPKVAKPLSPKTARRAAKKSAPRQASNDNLSYPVTPNQLSVLKGLAAPDCTASYREGLMLPQALVAGTKVDAKRLKRALAQVVHAHEALRTRFDYHNNQWRAIVEPKMISELTVVDLGEISDEELTRYAVEFADSPYDVLKGPLFEVRLVRLGKNSDAILTRCHHLFIDGWSQIKLYESLLNTYMGAAIEHNPALSTASLFREMDAQKKQSSSRQNSAYWKSVLEPWLPAPKFGRVNMNIPLNESGGWVFPRETAIAHVDGEAYARFNEQVKKSGVSMNSLLMSAFAKALTGLHGDEAMYLSSLYPRRTDPVFKDFVGFLVSDVPVRINCSESMSVHQIASEVHRQAMSSYARADMNFSISEVFEKATPTAWSHQRAICSSLAPEHLMQSSAFQSVGTGEEANEFSFGTTSIRTLPLPQRTLISSEIGLRPLATATDLTLWLSYEMPSFSREQADQVIDAMLDNLDIEKPATGHVRHRERFGAEIDWARVEEGKLPAASPQEGKTSEDRPHPKAAE